MSTTVDITPTNLIDVTSVEHFKSLLQQDLNRVSLINFWAPWAEPCKQMNEVVLELSKKHREALFLQVEAETHSEIAESFDIQVVPSFLILRGHALLSRIQGANAQALTADLAKYVPSPSAYKPLSHTTQSPARPLDSALEPKAEGPQERDEWLRQLMNQSKVVLFMKGSPDTPRCGFSRKIVALLEEQNVTFSHFDILTDETVRQGLKKLNDWPTFPQLIINGELVGGLDIAQEMVNSGELAELVA
ncbi:hypothetical protein APHAL10511_000781 [Amanita phalloides]|nr:hypothetical protein APHAL10511_000781 [Amanita phalloides]